MPHRVIVCYLTLSQIATYSNVILARNKPYCAMEQAFFQQQQGTRWVFLKGEGYSDLFDKKLNFCL